MNQNNNNNFNIICELVKKHWAILSGVGASGMGLVSFIYINFWIPYCPEIKPVAQESLAKLQNIQKNINGSPLKEGESSVYQENKNLFSQLNSEIKRNNLKEGKKIKDKILDKYYEKNNPDFYKYFRENKIMLEQGKSFLGVTHLYGVAGVGKSFIRKPIENMYGQEKTCVVKLIYAIGKDGDKYGSKIMKSPQLTADANDKTITFASLPKIIDPNSFTFNKLLEDSKCYSNNRNLKSIIAVFT